MKLPWGAGGRMREGDVSTPLRCVRPQAPTQIQAPYHHSWVQTWLQQQNRDKTPTQVLVPRPQTSDLCAVK